MKAGRARSLRSVPAVTRCAIYTRKSTDEGLDRDFNSLDAQRLAAEEFIRKHEDQGWVVVQDRYDDGGYSGACAERPALKRLLRDAAEGKMDCVVAYKSDRLSRSLLDSARILKDLEENGVKFISVTEGADVSTPGGRMHQNLLLLFAQYERELIAERTRDKVHAARRKGKFTGGMLVLGYDCDPKGGRLVVNEAEAERVQEIFRLFTEDPSLVAVIKELQRRGWTLKRWKTKENRMVGGGNFDKFSLKRLLTNPVYLGEVHFQGDVYPAEHEPIIDRTMWNRVHNLLAPSPDRPRTRSSRSTSLLAGILRCAPCDSAMTPTYSQKGKVRYRYYLCLKAHRRGWDSCPSKSVSAREIEKFVVDRIRAIGRDPELVTRTVEGAGKLRAGRMAELAAETRTVQRNLDQAHATLRGQIAPVSGNRRSPKRGQVATEAGINDLEKRLAAVLEELDALDRMRIEPANLRGALTAFDPVWDQLTSPEQARIVQLLIERIDYDGGTGRLDITFRPAGIRTLGENRTAPEEAGR